MLGFTGVSALFLLCAPSFVLSTASDEATALTYHMGAMNGAHAHQTTEEPALPLQAPTVLVAPKTMNDLPDDLLAHVLFCVQWKQGLRASRLVCRRWRGRLTHDWFLRWRSARKRFPESTQRELLRQVAQLDPLADGDLRGATALLASADMSIIVKSASFMSKAHDRLYYPARGEYDVERHATGWELGQDAQVIVSWNSEHRSIEDEELSYEDLSGDEDFSDCKRVQPSVFLIKRDQGARGFVWELCKVEQTHFSSEWVGCFQSESQALTTEAAARTFKDHVAAYLPEVAEMSPSVLLALTIGSSRTKLCDLLDSDPTVDCMVQENADAWTVDYLSQLIQAGMACVAINPALYDVEARRALYDGVNHSYHTLETIPVWFTPYKEHSYTFADCEAQLSLAKWLRSVQNSPSIVVEIVELGHEETGGEAGGDGWRSWWRWVLEKLGGGGWRREASLNRYLALDSSEPGPPAAT